jgi:hypothetical protein
MGDDSAKPRGLIGGARHLRCLLLPSSLRNKALVWMAPKGYIWRMWRVSVIISVASAFLWFGAFFAPVSAQTGQAQPPEEESHQDGPIPLTDLFERLLRGFLSEAEPQLRELERGFSALEPEIQRFLEDLRGMTQYHPARNSAQWRYSDPAPRGGAALAGSFRAQ